MQLRPFTRDSAGRGSSSTAADASSEDSSGEAPGVPPGQSGGTHARPRPAGWSRMRIAGVVLLAAVVVLIVLALLAKPLVDARSQAKAAQGDLTAAKTALSAGDLPTATAAIKSARDHVDAAHGDVHGLGAGFYGSLPVIGGAVDDARHLIDALSQTTKVAEIGAQVYPMVSGDKSTLMTGNSRIDPTVLKTVVALTTTIGPHLTQAIRDLHQVHGSTPGVGSSVTSARDSALAELTPVRDSYRSTAPLLRVLPSIIGANGNRSYLLAMLNPAELRYSGGAALSFTTINFTNGFYYLGGTQNVDDVIAHGGYFVKWKPVPGNPFHQAVKQRLTSATFSPYWSVSGEELLRAFGAVYPQHLNGVVVVDLQALAGLFSVTGPLNTGVQGVPPLTSHNLVKVLAGSYNTYSTKLRHQLNAALVPTFTQLLFGGGNITKKVQTIVGSAKGRHFAAYFRDPAVQHQFVKAGLSGNLAGTPHDYLGVFSQNTNGSKVDYWQHRTVTSQVKLNANGSADVHLRIKVKNQSPPYTGTVPDPKFGYSTSWLGTSLGVFLPTGTTLSHATINGKVLPSRLVTSHVKGVVNRPFFAKGMKIPDNGTRVLVLTYHVPHASKKTASGLSYSLDVDPQDTVVPEKLNVDVTWPSGYAPSSLPADWTATTAQTATWSGQVQDMLSFDIPLTKSN